MLPAAKALFAAFGFADKGVGVTTGLALVALAVAEVLSEDGTVTGPVGNMMVVLRRPPELATVTLGARVELLLVVR